MRLRVPKEFIKDVFEHFYYYILPSCRLWDEHCSIVMEPIHLASVRDGKLEKWQLLDKLVNASFNLARHRKEMAEGISVADGSDLEQVLERISPGVFSLFENPLTYPGRNLQRFFSRLAMEGGESAKFPDAICHIHPTGDVRLSEMDLSTFHRIAEISREFNKQRIFSLVVAISQIDKYVAATKGTRTEFLKYAMRRIDTVRIAAKAFQTAGSTSRVDIIVD